jgi:hypothetical protein
MEKADYQLQHVPTRGPGGTFATYASTNTDQPNKRSSKAYKAAYSLPKLPHTLYRPTSHPAL